MPLPKRIVSAPQPLPISNVIPPVTFKQVLSHTKTTPEIVIRQSHLMQLTRLISQLSDLSLYAHELFSDLVSLSTDTSLRIQKAAQKVDTMNQKIHSVKEKLDTLEPSIHIESKTDFKATVQIPCNLITPPSECVSIKLVYETCQNPPRLQELDIYRTDNVSCLKFYSYPQFFAEEWTKFMMKEIDEKKAKRKAKKNLKLSRQAVQKTDVAQIHVKKYTTEGELITDPTSPTYTSPTYKILTPTGPVPASILPPGPQRNPRFPGSPGGSPMLYHRNLSPTPPPPPPPPPPPSDGLSIKVENKTDRSSLLQSIVTGKQLKPTPERQSRFEGRDGVMNDIKGAQFKLRKVDRPVEPTLASRLTKNVEKSDVAQILMRRVAMEMSDSEEDSDSDDGEWD